jgi:hypothetical protein
MQANTFVRRLGIGAVTVRAMWTPDQRLRRINRMTSRGRSASSF